MHTCQIWRTFPKHIDDHEMPWAYPTWWSWMWNDTQKKFSFRKKKMATYLTALWKGIIFVECVSLCRSENAWKSIKYSFPGNYDWLFFWFWVLWIPDVWMNRAFASSKTRSVIILQKQSKKWFIWIKNSSWNNTVLQWRFISCALSATDFYNGKSAHIYYWLSRTLFDPFLII